MKKILLTLFAAIVSCVVMAAENMDVLNVENSVTTWGTYTTSNPVFGDTYVLEPTNYLQKDRACVIRVNLQSNSDDVYYVWDFDGDVNCQIYNDTKGAYIDNHGDVECISFRILTKSKTTNSVVFSRYVSFHFTLK